MKDERYERVTIRRTSRFTSYGIYDKDRKEFRNDLMSSRDVVEVDHEVKRLNDACDSRLKEGGLVRKQGIGHSG